MAVIPQIVTSPGSVPSAPTGSVGGGMPRASPQMDIPVPEGPAQAQAAGAQMEAGAYQSEAQSADRIAAYGEKFADQYITAKLNVDAANRTADLSAQLHQAEFESSKIADRDGATADFDSRVGKIRDDWAALDVNPHVREAVDANLPNQIALRRASTQQAAFGLESQAQVGQLITNIDQYNKQAVDALDPRLVTQLISQANQAIDGRVAGGWLNPEIAARMKVDFKSNVYRTKIELAMSKDMATGVALYNATKGELNAADGRAMGIMAADRAKQVDAETAVNAGIPKFNAGGGGGFDNNPGNITASGAPYSGGKTGAFAAPSGLKFETFASPEHGVAAQYSLVKQKVDAAGGNLSFEGLVAAWDPPASAEVKANYAKKLADAAGLKPGDNVPIGDDAKMAAVLKAQNQFEKGKQTVPDLSFENGIKLAKGDTSVPLTQTQQQSDALSQYRIDALKYIQSQIDDPTLDPEIRARRIAIASQRLNNTNAIVTEQRKSAADDGETAGIDLFTGQYKAGTFQQISDRFRAAGDNSNAAAYQILADRESEAIKFGQNPPARMPIFGALLPGVAGKIAHEQVAEQRADLTANRTEYRRLSAEQEKNFDDGLSGGVDPRVLIGNAHDAVRFSIAAGDTAKAQSIQQKLEGALAGSEMAQLPPAEREKARAEMQQILSSKQGLTTAEATAIKVAERMHAKGQELWDKDPLTAASHVQGQNGPVITLQPFDINMDDGKLVAWSAQRLKDTTRATALRNPNATNIETPFFTVPEMSDITQKLEHMRPDEAKQFLARLAKVVSPQVIPLIGQQMSKKDPVSDSYSAAMGLYARGQDGDIDIANHIIDGMNLWQRGGPDGKTRVETNAALFSAIDGVLGKARVGMSPDAIRMQNNAIMANYVWRTQNDPQRGSTNINQDELTNSITEIVGKKTSHNGVDTIIPREIEPYQFRNGVAAITPDDVANLRPARNGQPYTAESIRRDATFKPSGDGKYQVYMPDPLRGTTVQVIDTTTGRPWVIDIKPLIGRGVTGAQRDLPTGPRDPLGQNRGTVPLPEPVVPPAPAAPAAPTGAELIRQNQRRGMTP